MTRRTLGIIPLISIIIFSLSLQAQIVPPNPVVPTQFKLYQNEPNPFQKNGVRIIFDVPLTCTVHLWIEDSSGAFYKDLINSTQAAGRYSVYWDAKANESTYVSPGLYYAKLLTSWDTQSFRDSIAMTFMYTPDIFAPYSSITFRDIEAFSMQRLYFGRADSSVNLARFEMPPAPPAGVFDVRYTSGRILELASYAQSDTLSIDVASVAFPLTIKWNFSDSLSLHAYMKVNGDYINMADVDSLTVDTLTSQLALRLDPLVLVGVKGNGKFPLSFALHQNYPNPFNPVTKISYNIPAGGFVTVRVYDILGREITTLVNEFLPAGQHQVDFSSGQLSSGIYYYRLQAGNFISIKKMVLMR
jgi:hypothetical protein